ncbi:MAG: helix-turn-helix transcriptional regulator, partial [Terriglobales bacterium]
ALYRLEEQGWIRSSWGESDNKRKAKFYALTPAGRRRLASEEQRWYQMADIMAGILQASPEER